MKLSFFCPYWGMESLSVSDAFKKIANAGYDGVEIAIDPAKQSLKEISMCAEQTGLQLLVQHAFTEGRDFPTMLKDYTQKLSRLTTLHPVLINCHTGKDYFSMEDNLRFLEAANAIATESGICVAHETHRGRFSYSASLTAKYLDYLPSVPLVADLSHWCVVSESLLEEQQSLIDRILENCVHIHARVGEPQSPQVADPALLQYEKALNAHMRWWRQLAAKFLEQGKNQMTITCEFGPSPYLPTTPYTKAHAPSQWELNLFMKNHLQNHLLL